METERKHAAPLPQYNDGDAAGAVPADVAAASGSLPPVPPNSRQQACEELLVKAREKEAQGATAQGLALREQLMLRAKQVFGETAPETLDAAEGFVVRCNRLAMSLLRGGELTAAFELMRKAEILTDQGGVLRHAQVARLRCRAVTLNNLGLFYRHRGQLPAALEHLEQALEIEEACADARSENPAATLLNLCAVLSATGRHQVALAYAQKALTSLQRSAQQQGGRKDPRAAKLRSDAAPPLQCMLAAAHHAVGCQHEGLRQYTEAAEAFLAAYSISKQEVGAGDQATLSYYRNYTAALQRARAGGRSLPASAVEPPSRAARGAGRDAAMLPRGRASHSQRRVSVTAQGPRPGLYPQPPATAGTFTGAGLRRPQTGETAYSAALASLQSGSPPASPPAAAPGRAYVQPSLREQQQHMQQQERQQPRTHVPAPPPPGLGKKAPRPPPRDDRTTRIKQHHTLLYYPVAAGSITNDLSSAQRRAFDELCALSLQRTAAGSPPPMPTEYPPAPADPGPPSEARSPPSPPPADAQQQQPNRYPITTPQPVVTRQQLHSLPPQPPARRREDPSPQAADPAPQAPEDVCASAANKKSPVARRPPTGASTQSTQGQESVASTKSVQPPPPQSRSASKASSVASPPQRAQSRGSDSKEGSSVASPLPRADSSPSANADAEGDAAARIQRSWRCRNARQEAQRRREAAERRGKEAAHAPSQEGVDSVAREESDTGGGTGPSAPATAPTAPARAASAGSLPGQPPASAAAASTGSLPRQSSTLASATAQPAQQAPLIQQQSPATPVVQELQPAQSSHSLSLPLGSVAQGPPMVAGSLGSSMPGTPGAERPIPSHLLGHLPELPLEQRKALVAKVVSLGAQLESLEGRILEEAEEKARYSRVEREKIRQRRAEAACTIQRVWRGRMARTRCKRLRQEREEAKLRAIEEERRRQAASLRIQTQWRRFSAMSLAQRLRDDRRELVMRKANQRATTIQACCRQQLSEMRAEYLREEFRGKCARRIQARWRGVDSRAQFARIKAEWDEKRRILRFAAAVRVQRWWHVLRERKRRQDFYRKHWEELERTRKPVFAVRRVQLWWRWLRFERVLVATVLKVATERQRERLLSERADRWAAEANERACVVQRAFRCYLSRRQLDFRRTADLERKIKYLDTETRQDAVQRLQRFSRLCRALMLVRERKRELEEFAKLEEWKLRKERERDAEMRAIAVLDRKAARIQSLWRGFTARCLLRASRQGQVAAWEQRVAEQRSSAQCEIARVWRGVMARLRVGPLKEEARMRRAEEKLQRQMVAARTLQCAWRCCLARVVRRRRGAAYRLRVQRTARAELCHYSALVVAAAWRVAVANKRMGVAREEKAVQMRRVRAAVVLQYSAKMLRAKSQRAARRAAVGSVLQRHADEWKSLVATEGLQRTGRGHSGRLAAHDMHHRRRAAAARALQQWWRLCVPAIRQRLAAAAAVRACRAAENRRDVEDASAGSIQCLWRGYRVRKQRGYSRRWASWACTVIARTWKCAAARAELAQRSAAAHATQRARIAAETAVHSSLVRLADVVVAHARHAISARVVAARRGAPAPAASTPVATASPVPTSTPAAAAIACLSSAAATIAAQGHAARPPAESTPAAAPATPSPDLRQGWAPLHWDEMESRSQVHSTEAAARIDLMTEWVRAAAVSAPRSRPSSAAARVRHTAAARVQRWWKQLRARRHFLRHREEGRAAKKMVTKHEAALCIQCLARGCTSRKEAHRRANVVAAMTSARLLRDADAPRHEAAERIQRMARCASARVRRECCAAVAAFADGQRLGIEGMLEAEINGREQVEAGEEALRWMLLDWAGRGHADTLRNIREAELRRQSSAATIQRNVRRGFAAKERARREKTARGADQTQAQDDAATTIQSTWRGCTTRRRLRVGRQDAAARKIQSFGNVVRGKRRVGRKRAERAARWYGVRSTESAEVIQRAVRCNSAERQRRRMMRERDGAQDTVRRNDAASVIARFMRSLTGLRHLNLRRRKWRETVKEDAVVAIQATYRAFRCARSYREMRAARRQHATEDRQTERRIYAAVKIQRWWVMVLAMQRVKRMKAQKAQETGGEEGS
eukprot:TRINITY_DN5933_c0_g1_i1.p1 TRINITY_DN5933_c0_g1~~TRINITY_DN5933_c0_g1_i1.p1  ORF type:complete len:2095 (+),score=487.87 TRINITY_DN5933_c0_g1_i1:59-6343(+)